MGFEGNKGSNKSEAKYLFGDSDSDMQTSLRQALYDQLMPAIPGMFSSQMGMTNDERQRFGSQSMGDLAAAQAGEAGRIEQDMARRGLGGSGVEVKDLDINRDRYARERATALTDLEKFNLGLKRQDRSAFTGNIRELLGASGQTSSGKQKGGGVTIPM